MGDSCQCLAEGALDAGVDGAERKPDLWPDLAGIISSGQAVGDTAILLGERGQGVLDGQAEGDGRPGVVGEQGGLVGFGVLLAEIGGGELVMGELAAEDIAGAPGPVVHDVGGGLIQEAGLLGIALEDGEDDLLLDVVWICVVLAGDVVGGSPDAGEQGGEGIRLFGHWLPPVTQVAPPI